MLKVIKYIKEAKILIVTPLLTGRKISSQTRTSIQRNDSAYSWASFESTDKHAKNVQNCIDAFEKQYKLPEYIQVLDDDIIPGRYMLDRFMALMDKSPDEVAFIYAPFSYRGHTNVTFPPVEYDLKRLMRSNWISSNSLYRTSAIKKVGGFVVEEDTHRLSDWAMWLKFAAHGYVGRLCSNTSFVAMSTDKDISAGSDEEFHKTRELVTERYVKPILAMLSEEIKHEKRSMA